MAVSAVDEEVVIILGRPVEPVEPVGPAKKENAWFYFLPANGQQNKAPNLFEISSNEFSEQL
jgi:hypothetical protein